MEIIIALLTLLLITLCLRLFFLDRAINNLTKDITSKRVTQSNLLTTTSTSNKSIKNLVTELNLMFSLLSESYDSEIKEKERFKVALHNITHDIRTPLTISWGYVQQLIQESNQNSIVLKKIESNIKLVSKRLEVLLEFQALLEKQDLELEKIGTVVLAMTMLVESSTLSFATEVNEPGVGNFAVAQTSVEAATINPITDGDNVITGTLPAYGTTDTGEKIKLTYSDAAMLSINGKAYNQNTISGNQMFNYTITPVNDETYSFSFTLPNNESFNSGDKLNWFVIPATLPLDAPQLSQKLSSEVVVGVKQVAVNVHDSTIYVGDRWNAQDNFDSATDKNGNNVDFSQIIVDESQMDTSKPGVYKVTYTYDGVSSVATITVLGDQSSVIVHDSELTVGDSWEPRDNFDSATDFNGEPLDFENFDVEGSVDTSKVGTYKVTYSLTSSFFSSENQGTDSAVATITVKEAQPVKGGNVTAKYIDTDGNKISDDAVKTGNVGETYTTEQKSIEGYTFKEVQGKPTGRFTDQAQTVTYVYTKNEIPNLIGTILVKYVDTDGNKISEDVVKSGTVGEGYSTEKKDIEGWIFKEVRGNKTGKFTNQVQTVTYVYAKNKANPVTPEPKPENKPDSNDKNNNQGITYSPQHGLPATGENERMTMMSIILGLILLALGAVISISGLKKVNK